MPAKKSKPVAAAPAAARTTPAESPVTIETYPQEAVLGKVTTEYLIANIEEDSKTGQQCLKITAKEGSSEEAKQPLSVTIPGIPVNYGRSHSTVQIQWCGFVDQNTLCVMGGTTLLLWRVHVENGTATKLDERSLSYGYPNSALLVGRYVCVVHTADAYDLEIFSVVNDKFKREQLQHDGGDNIASRTRSKQRRCEMPQQIVEEQEEEDDNEEDLECPSRLPTALTQQMCEFWDVIDLGEGWLATMPTEEGFFEGPQFVHLIDMSKLTRMYDVPCRNGGAQRVLKKGNLLCVDNGPIKDFWDLGKKVRYSKQLPEAVHVAFSPILGGSFMEEYARQQNLLSGAPKEIQDNQTEQLRAAILNQKLKAAKEAHKKGGAISEDMVDVAFETGKEPLVQWVVEHAPSEALKLSHYTMAQQQHYKKSKQLMQLIERKIPSLSFYLAVKSGSLSLAAAELNKPNVDVEFGQPSPLTCACRKNHLGLIKLLIQKGASVMKSDNYQSPLSLICSFGFPLQRQYVIEAAMNSEEGRQWFLNEALREALWNQSGHSVEVAIERGANPNEVHAYGGYMFRPLQLAAVEMRSLSLTKVLVKCGASCDLALLSPDAHRRLQVTEPFELVEFVKENLSLSYKLENAITQFDIGKATQLLEDKRAVEKALEKGELDDPKVFKGAFGSLYEHRWESQLKVLELLLKFGVKPSVLREAAKDYSQHLLPVIEFRAGNVEVADVQCCNFAVHLVRADSEGLKKDLEGTVSPQLAALLQTPSQLDCTAATTTNSKQLAPIQLLGHRYVGATSYAARTNFSHSLQAFSVVVHHKLSRSHATQFLEFAHRNWSGDHFPFIVLKQVLQSAVENPGGSPNPAISRLIASTELSSAVQVYPPDLEAVRRCVEIYHADIFYPLNAGTTEPINPEDLSDAHLNATPFAAAAMQGNVEALKYFLSKFNISKEVLKRVKKAINLAHPFCVLSNTIGEAPPFTEIDMDFLASLLHGQTKGALEALKAGASVNIRGPHGASPLMLAVQVVALPAALEILKRPELDLSIRNDSSQDIFSLPHNDFLRKLLPLLEAKKRGDSETLTRLIEEASTNSPESKLRLYNELLGALSAGPRVDFELVKRLVEAGAIQEAKAVSAPDPATARKRRIRDSISIVGPETTAGSNILSSAVSYGVPTNVIAYLFEHGAPAESAITMADRMSDKGDVLDVLGCVPAAESSADSEETQMKRIISNFLWRSSKPQAAADPANIELPEEVQRSLSYYAGSALEAVFTDSISRCTRQHCARTSIRIPRVIWLLRFLRRISFPVFETVVVQFFANIAQDYGDWCLLGEVVRMLQEPPNSEENRNLFASLALYVGTCANDVDTVRWAIEEQKADVTKSFPNPFKGKRTTCREIAEAGKKEDVQRFLRSIH